MDDPPPIQKATVCRTSASAKCSHWFGRGRGRSLRLSALPYGAHVLRAAVQNAGEGDGEASWLVERTRDRRYFWHRGTISYPDPECSPGSVTSTIEKRNPPKPA